MTHDLRVRLDALDVTNQIAHYLTVVRGIVVPTDAFDDIRELLSGYLAAALPAEGPAVDHSPTCSSWRCAWAWRTENGAGVCRQPRDSEIHYVGTVDSHEFAALACDCREAAPPSGEALATSIPAAPTLEAVGQRLRDYSSGMDAGYLAAKGTAEEDR